MTFDNCAPSLDAAAILRLAEGPGTFVIVRDLIMRREYRTAQRIRRKARAARKRRRGWA